MPSVLLLAVNRHQERYFRKIASATPETFDFTVLHDSGLPLFFRRFSVSATERAVLRDVVRLKVATDAQEVRGYSLSPLRRQLLTLKYYFSVYFFFLRARHYFQRSHFDLVGLWSGMKWRQRIIRQLLLTPDTKTMYFENGAFPDTTTLDPQGVNFGSSIPDDPEFYFSYSFDESVKLPDSLSVRQGKIKKAGMSGTPLPERYIFVPFQVDSDTQIVEYSPWIRNMQHLYELLVQVAESAGNEMPVFVVKEHPSSKNDYHYLHEMNHQVRFYNQVNTQELIEGAECVLTINSSVGFEALLLNKPVVTLGQAFYALPGLVSAAESKNQVIKACLKHCLPEQGLREKFLKYLYSTYYVQGNWRQADQTHLKQISHRIEQVLESQ